MANSAKKLVTWKQWVLGLSAVVVGTSLHVYKEYHDTGSVQPSSIVISVVTFCVGLCIIVVVFRYANRPEKGVK